MQRSAAEGYQQNSLSEQKVDSEDFIQTDVCPKVGDVILDLGCGTGELSAYLAELVGPEQEKLLVSILIRSEFSWPKRLTIKSRISHS